MVEVLKTDVTERNSANMLVTVIHETFDSYRANFDLDDRDRILRVQSDDGPVSGTQLVELLRDFGFHAEVLVDELEFTSSKLIK